jgi:hypothetical protein
MDDLTIRPSLAPRGIADALITIGLLLVVGVLLWLLVFRVAPRLGASPLLMLYLPPLVALLIRARAVGSLRLNAEGIRFVRQFGSPGLVPWERIRIIRPAGRWEVIWQGWLRTPLNPREATTTMSSEGHYRIEWDTGVAFFPPLDEGAFREAVLQRLGMDVWSRRDAARV